MISFSRSTQTPKINVIAASILFGILAGFGLSTIGSFGPPLKSYQENLPDSVFVIPDDALAASSQRPPPTAQIDLEALREMVAHTNGFYARDYSLWLGWNNMRYIIETALLHGRILNRTSIIPSFVYARACEFDIYTCAAWATMVNRGDAVGSDEWRLLPYEKQMAWRIPISLMFNLTHIRETHSVVTVSEFLRLHNISADVETGRGDWDTEAYHHISSTGERKPSLRVIENDWYDPGEIVRVDRIPDDMRERGGWTPEGGDSSRAQIGTWNTTSDTSLYHALMDHVPSQSWPVLSWKDVRMIVEDGERITSQSSDEEVQDVLKENGFEALYTYDGAAGMDAVKDVALPILEAAPRERIQGLYEDFSQISTEVLLVRGEIHWTRKPGSLFFTTADNRARFTQTVLYDIRLTENVIDLAWKLRDRMLAINDGRLWMAGHMRRGDFVRLQWAMEADFKAHLARVKMHLEEGRHILESIHGGNVTTYDVPDAKPDPSLSYLDPPLPDDKFYIATDERDPGNLAYLREQGAILISDLLTFEDRREFGWAIMLTDVLALLEQSLLSHAAYFYAHAFSSVAGGVMNLRASLGADPRTAKLE
ncbi:hypothetical protein BKA82DRAFT_996464 [Pisolithus tinctorius]|uniref:Uncharacterized protein n=1 Tax=Pisolithus tinctorius Marx 270 TaxID=870435 RepID=A0A0C3KJ72_PISTI|nr:hypothetical protein BKA82DRAFT_996464 [Pisolithus tinctorius]KIO09632.1 hypothetical protein M404DRAFT_996464 [Pisolithus tinctorius Marx 270]